MTKKEKALAALLSCDTQAEAAKKAGMTDRTIRNYLANPDFAAELMRRKRQLVADATRQMQANYQAAINALREVLDDQEAPPAARISAARAVLEFGIRFTELSDVLPRLEAVERVVKK